MRIDLRYLIPVAAFYAPGLMLLIGAWALGYSTREAREVLAFLGGLFGGSLALPLGIVLFTSHKPIWFQLW